MFIDNGDHFAVISNKSLKTLDTLPANTYTIMQDQNGNLLLSIIENLDFNSKIYGDTEFVRDRIINTFEKRGKNTGILLSGEKGSGKTMLVKLLSKKLREEKSMPTIIVNKAWKGDKFNSFLQMIEQPCVVIFDEFEKIYNQEDQQEILTLFDGVYPSEKLFLVTINNLHKVDDNMKNRPGRFFYHLKYEGLSIEFIKEYCEDNLNNKEHTASVVNLAKIFNRMNFDALKAIVEEMNRYDEPLERSMKFLNASPEYAPKNDYEVEIWWEGKKMPKQAIHTDEISLNLTTFTNHYFHFDIEIDGEETTKCLNASVSNIKSYDPEAECVTFFDDGITVILKKKKYAPRKFSFY